MRKSRHFNMWRSRAWRCKPEVLSALTSAGASTLFPSLRCSLLRCAKFVSQSHDLHLPFSPLSSSTAQTEHHPFVVCRISSSLHITVFSLTILHASRHLISAQHVVQPIFLVLRKSLRAVTTTAAIWRIWLKSICQRNVKPIRAASK